MGVLASRRVPGQTVALCLCLLFFASPGGAATRSQTEATPRIRAIADGITGANALERIQAAMRYVGEHLAYDPADNARQFLRDADQLFADQTLGGCAEFALAELALIRAMGFEARLALTVNDKWIKRWRENDLATPNGHSFIEVLLDGNWLLLDPTYFNIYGGYAPGAPYLPGNEIFMIRCGDFWEIGVTSVDAANAMLREKAAGFDGAYAKPSFPKIATVEFDFPKAFKNLGDVFAHKGKDRLALRLLRKSLELDPDYLPALLSRADFYLRRNAPDKALADLVKAARIAPDSPYALERLKQARDAAAGARE